MAAPLTTVELKSRSEPSRLTARPQLDRPPQAYLARPVKRQLSDGHDHLAAWHPRSSPRITSCGVGCGQTQRENCGRSLRAGGKTFRDELDAKPEGLVFAQDVRT